LFIFFYWILILITILLGPYLSIATYLLQFIITIIFIQSKYSIHKNFNDYGIKWTNKSSKTIILGIFLGLVSIGLIVAIEYFFGMIYLTPLIIYAPEDIILNISSFVLVQILVSVFEEFEFRGFILRNLKEQSIWKAISWSSILFSLAHLPSIFIITTSNNVPLIFPFMMILFLFEAGILLGSLTVRYQNIWASIGFHFSWNLFQYHIFGLTGDGLLPFFPLDQYSLFTGGLMGPEAGVIGLLLIFLLNLILYRSIKEKRSDGLV
ncbi:MAG: lysostaphin resistance A-like protein, partial [Candidatus Ranarchaeia archaeon]